MKNNPQQITGEKLLQYPGFENLPKEQAEEIASHLRELAWIVFQQMIRTQTFVPPEITLP